MDEVDTSREAVKNWVYTYKDGGSITFNLQPVPLIMALLERAETAERRLNEAESALWRIYPGTHTIEVEGVKGADPFEGPGEMYREAYLRLESERDMLWADFEDCNTERARWKAKAQSAEAERDRLRAAVQRQVDNIDRWLVTGVPASEEESESIYNQLAAALVLDGSL